MISPLVDIIENKASVKKSLQRRLFGHVFNFGIGKALPKLIGFLLIPVYTLYLTPSDYGIVDITTSFGSLLLVFMRLGIPGSVTRFYFEFGETDALKDYITTVFWFLLGASVVIGLIIGGVGYIFAAQWFPATPFYPFIILIIGWAILQSNTDLQRRLLLAREQSRYSAILSVAISAITISLTVLMVIVFHWGAIGVIVALVFSAFVFFIQGQFYLRPELKGNYKSILLSPSLSYGIGILPSHLLANFMPYFSKSLLGNWDSIAAVGVYGIANRFYMPLAMLIDAFQSSFIAIYFSYRKKDAIEGYKDLGKTLTTAWLSACLIFQLFVWCAPPIIYWLLPKSYHEAADLLPILTLGFLFQSIYSINIQEVFFQKRTLWSSLATGMGAVTNLIIIFLGFTHLKVYSLAWGFTGSWLLMALVSVIFAHKNFRLLLNLKITLFHLILSCFLFAIRQYLVDTLPQLYIQLLIGVGVVVGYFFGLVASGTLSVKQWSNWRSKIT